MTIEIANIDSYKPYSLKNFIQKFSVLLTTIYKREDPRIEELERTYNSAVKQYTDLIDRICFGYAKNIEDLEDLRQDSLINLWESMSAYKGKCSLKTWIYRITLNTCVSYNRKNTRRISTVSISQLYDIIDSPNTDKQLILDLHEAIGGLNPVEKAIIILWLEELPYDEIAHIVGISKSNVAVRIHRIKEKLRDTLNPQKNGRY